MTTMPDIASPVTDFSQGILHTFERRALIRDIEYGNCGSGKPSKLWTQRLPTVLRIFALGVCR